MPIYHPIFLFFTAALSPAAHAAGLWGSQGYTGFSNGLQAASNEGLKKTTRHYLTVLQRRAGLDLDRIRVATFKDIDPLLARATQSSLGRLDLFTQKALADPSAPALSLDGPTLRQIDVKYHLSGAWVISARTLRPDHRAMTMDYMIVGQGKLIVGYPYESSVEVIDEGKPLEYRYEPFIEARIINDGARQGLFDIKALNNPAAAFLAFQGPLGAAVKSFQVEGDTVLVNYSLGFDQQARSDKTPTALKRTHVTQAL